jgi:hypothetical protein
MKLQIRTRTKAIILSICFGLGLMMMACTGPEPVKEIPSFNLVSSKSEISSAESVSLTASVAADVIRVEFFRGVTKLGEDTEAPFTQVVPLTNADNGEVAFSAKAFDATGLVGTSKQVSVTVGIFLWAKEFDTEVSGNVGVGYPYGGATATNIAIDKDNNIFIAGICSGNFVGQKSAHFSVFLIKLDQKGEFLWVRQTGPANFPYFYDVQLDEQGNVYIAGQSYVPSETVYTYESLTKFDTNGVQLWHKKLESESILEFSINKFGNIYAIGYAVGTDGNFQKILSKSDLNGNRIWVKNIDTEEKSDLTDLELAEDGSIYILGNYLGESEPKLDGYEPKSSRGFAAKYDSGGIQLWSKDLISGSNQTVSSVKIDKDGNTYYLIHQRRTQGEDAHYSELIFKIDTNGNQSLIKKYNQVYSVENYEWEYQGVTYPGEIKKFLSVRDFLVDELGNITVLGTISWTDERIPLVEDDGFIEKVDQNGNSIWRSNFGQKYLQDSAVSIALDNEGTNYFVTGSNINRLYGVRSASSVRAFIRSFTSAGVQR